LAERGGFEPLKCVSTHFNVFQRVAVKMLKFQRVEPLSIDFSAYEKRAFKNKNGAKMVHRKSPEDHFDV